MALNLLQMNAVNQYQLGAEPRGISMWAGRIKLMLGVGALVLGVVFSSAYAAQLLYTIKDLGTLGGNNSFGYGINQSGQVTGGSETSDGKSRAFVTSVNGDMFDLGLGDDSVGYAINNHGLVTGYAHGATCSLPGNGPNSYCVFISDFNGNKLPLNGYISNTRGAGINNLGNITGDVFLGADLGNIPVISYGGTTTNLLPLYSRGAGYDINDSNQVTGAHQRNDGDYIFVTDSNRQATYLGKGTGVGINASGQVTGYLDLGDYSKPIYHAFVTDHTGAVVDLGTLSGFPASYGIDINASGQVVGTADNQPGINGVISHRAIVTDNGILKDLNTLLASSDGWELNGATSINDAGQITGIGKHNGVTHAFLLTPVNLVIKQWQPLSNVTVQQGTRFANGANGYYTLNTLVNNSGQTLNGPVRLVVTSTTHTVTNAAGTTDQGLPYFNALVQGESLVNTASGNPIRINFALKRGAFAYSLAVQQYK